MDHIYFYLAAAIGMCRISYEFWRFGNKVSPLAIYIFCYFYFCFGPYLANMLNIPIYSGIQLTQLEKSSFVFFLAIATLSLFPSNALARIGFKSRLTIREPTLFKQICLGFLSIPVVFLFLLAFSRIGFADLDKVQRIQSVGIFHYVILTLWPLFLFCLLTVLPAKQLAGNVKWLFLLIVVFYFSYCFYMKERDFALIFVPLYFWFYKDRSISKVKLILGLTAVVLMFTLMSGGRSSEFDSGGLGSFLNQGSNLMVTSNILLWIENGEPLQLGMSYFSGLVNMLTLGAVKMTLPLSIWFSRRYSSAVNDGAFGFSIEGEALINFGVWGIPALFIFISYVLARAYKRYRSGCPLGTLMTYFALFYFVYAIRGEMLILMKAYIYTLIIFYGLLVMSQRGSLYIGDKDGT